MQLLIHGFYILLSVFLNIIDIRQDIFPVFLSQNTFEFYFLRNFLSGFIDNALQFLVTQHLFNKIRVKLIIHDLVLNLDIIHFFTGSEQFIFHLLFVLFNLAIKILANGAHRAALMFLVQLKLHFLAILRH